jgi:peptidoglycan hydrolase-like protein with peptidoglycan-binding domain
VKTVCVAVLLALAAGTFLTPSEAYASVQKKSSTKRKSGKATGMRKAVSNRKVVPNRRAVSTQKKPVPATWRATQQVPTTERYRQIQQALVEKGYLTGPPSGVWGSESMEAIKRFQKEQNLEPNGKLTSLSLIALGLGPKQDLNNREGQPSNAGTRTNK